MLKFMLHELWVNQTDSLNGVSNEPAFSHHTQNAGKNVPLFECSDQSASQWLHALLKTSQMSLLFHNLVVPKTEFEFGFNIYKSHPSCNYRLKNRIIISYRHQMSFQIDVKVCYFVIWFTTSDYIGVGIFGLTHFDQR